MKKFIAIIMLCIFPQGCATTFLTFALGEPILYGGVLADTGILTMPYNQDISLLWRMWAFFDLPLSFVLDTIIMPIAILWDNI